MEVEITGFDFEGRGVARLHGKAIFVAGALPSEIVNIKILKEKKQFSEAIVTEVMTPSPARIIPSCEYFDRCGGCALQHVDFKSQIQLKEQVFLEQLARIGKVSPKKVLPPVSGNPWHYRSRARFRWQEKAHSFGFLAKGSHQVISINHCAVLPQQVSEQLPAIQAFCRTLRGISGLDVSVGENVIVLRIEFSRPFTDSEREKTRQAVALWNQQALQPWQVWLQQGKAVEKFPTSSPTLDYFLPDFNLSIPFYPDDFTQINQQVNREMIRLVIQALEIETGEKIVDFFSGLGNFSLPLAREGANVLGIEGVSEMVKRAKDNAIAQGLAQSCTFQRADLFTISKKDSRDWGKRKKWLLDPPRAGAQALCASLEKPFLPAKIVYVSCNPSTLARDARLLTEKGFHLVSVRVLNMFAQTAHVESIAVFER